MQWRRLNAAFLCHHIVGGWGARPKSFFFVVAHSPWQDCQSGVARSFGGYTEETNNKYVKRVWDASSKGHAVEQQTI
eukprot:8770293-Pyramimonas_sp.AAC.1